MKLERSKQEDFKECADWLTGNRLNGLSLRTLKGSTFYKIAGILYLPVKPVLLLESLAPNPAITGTKRLLALRRAMEELRRMYPGVELVFMTHGDNPLSGAAKIYGFEESDYALYRFIPSETAEKRKFQSTESLSEIRLRNDARKSRRDEAKTKRDVPDLCQAT